MRKLMTSFLNTANLSIQTNNVKDGTGQSAKLSGVGGLVDTPEFQSMLNAFLDQAVQQRFVQVDFEGMQEQINELMDL